MSSANKLYFILTRPGISVCVSALSPFLSQRCHLSLHLTVWKPQKQESIQSISEGTCPFSENYTVNVEISVWGKSNRKILWLFLSFFLTFLAQNAFCFSHISPARVNKRSCFPQMVTQKWNTCICMQKKVTVGCIVAFRKNVHVIIVLTLP